MEIYNFPQYATMCKHVGAPCIQSEAFYRDVNFTIILQLYYLAMLINYAFSILNMNKIKGNGFSIHVYIV